MPRIFISYRRNDSGGRAGRLYDRLIHHFGQGQVFMDVDAIKPGVNFVEVVEQAVSVCDGLVAVIGPEWLRASDPTGRRLDDPADMVRLEIATALERDIRVIPVLVQGAQMPRAADLPEDLKGLAHRNALEISDNRFRTDIDQLIKALEAPAAEALADSVFVEPTQSSVSGFVGREREMGELKVALEEALSGQGRIVMLVGEPGIGKTRTAQQLASHAESLGAHVLWGPCYEAEGAPPYWPWVQPIRSYVQQTGPEQLRSEMGPGAADIAEIVPEIKEKLPDLEPSPALEPEQARFRLFDSITTFLKNAALARGLVLTLDDLHWADRPSLLMLQFLVRRLAGSRIMVLGCYRDVELSRQHPLSETLAQLSREPAFGREVLRGLSQEDTGRFIEATAGSEPPPALAETIHRHTEGNPYFITEVVRLLTDQGELFGASSTLSESQHIRIPEGVREVIGQRFNRLSEHCNQALTTASIIGREFGFNLLDTLSGLNEDELLTVIDEALEARLIEELPGRMDRYRFSHALVQETLSAELSTSRRVRLHARIGEELVILYGNSVEAHAAELAYHFAEAEPVLGPDKLVQYSILAGGQALSTYAYEEAIVHYERALAVKEEHRIDKEGAALLFGLGRAQVATLPRHQLGQAVQNLRLAFDYYEEIGDVAQAVAVAECPISVVLGQRTGAAQLLVRALALVPADSQEAGRLLSHYGNLLTRQEGDYQGGQDAFNRALAIAQREGDAALEMRILANSSQADIASDNLEEGGEKSRRAVELAGRVDDPHSEVIAHWQVLEFLVRKHDLEGARREGAAMLATAERLRNRDLLNTALYQNAFLAREVGDWSTARSYCGRVLELEPADPRLLAVRAIVEYETGDFDQGEADLESLVRVMGLTPPGPTMGHGFLAALIPRIAQITGVLDRLDIAKAAAEAILSSSSATRNMRLGAQGGLAFQVLLRGDTVEAQEQYIALESRRGTISFFSQIAADRLLGLLSAIMAQLEVAIAHFEDAVALCRDAGYHPELAWTCCDYADTLLRRNDSGDREKARSLLDESLAISTELGMRPLMERVIFRQDGLQA